MVKKREIIGILIFLVVFVFAYGVYAAGTGEGGERGNLRNDSINNTFVNDTDTNRPIRNETNRTREYQPRDCEVLNKTLDRIRCRIIQGANYTAPSDNVPEACRLQNETKKGRCVAFYATIRTCYKLPAKAKDACFRWASGLVKKFSEETQEGRKEKARDYMITLLYDLEERVEKTQEKGKIDADEAASLVDKIVEIKKAILEGKTKAEIKSMLRELKDMWRSYKEKIDSVKDDEDEVENG